MALEQQAIYANAKAEVRIVSGFCYPVGAITPDTEYKTHVERDPISGVVKKQWKTYRTLNANNPKGLAWVSYYTVDDLQLYIDSRGGKDKKSQLVNTSDPKVRRLIKKIGIKYFRVPPSEFAKWIGFKSGMALDFTPLPDTSMNIVSPKMRAELEALKADKAAQLAPVESSKEKK